MYQQVYNSALTERVLRTGGKAVMLSGRTATGGLKELPQNMVFVGIIAPYAQPEMRYIALTTNKNQLFVLPNNGLLTYVVKNMGNFAKTHNIKAGKKFKIVRQTN
jgi:hypothetical protein